MGVVVSIHVVPEKHGPAIELGAAHFLADYGLEGDWRSRKGRSRQMTLIEMEALERVASQLGLPDVAPGASRRQVVVRDVRLDETIGKRLQIGPAIVRVEQSCDPCSRMEVTIGPRAREHLGGHGGVCARVIEGGTIRPGDSVTIVDGD